MPQVKRCGIILQDNRTRQCLLVQGRWSSKWGFPKGHMEAGETEEDTAIRELFEETGVLVHPPLGMRYRFKNNVYFLMPVDRELIKPFIRDHREIQNIRWFSEHEMSRLPVERCNYGLTMYRTRVAFKDSVAPFPLDVAQSDVSANLTWRQTQPVLG